MTITLHLLWWYLPAAIAVISSFFLPVGPGGAFIAALGWLLAIGIVIGHFL